MLPQNSDMNLIREIVENITESADELLAKGKNNLNPVEQGQLWAYAEALSIIRDTLSGYDLKAISLDFDIDEKYLA